MLMVSWGCEVPRICISVVRTFSPGRGVSIVGADGTSPVIVNDKGAESSVALVMGSVEIATTEYVPSMRDSFVNTIDHSPMAFA